MYLRHVTLDTGHSRDSAREEVTDEAIAAASAGLASAFAGIKAPLAAGTLGAIPDGYAITAVRHGRCAVITVWRKTLPVYSIGLAQHGRCGKALWRAMHDLASMPVTTDPHTQPSAPWIASRLDIGISQDPSAAQWLGDYARCVGWAWTEMTGND